MFLAEDRTGEWNGIDSDLSIDILQGRSSIPYLDHSHVLTTRLVFRSAIVRTELALQASDIAFRDWVEPLLSRRARIRRRLTFRRMAKLGFYRPVSVVAATRLISRAQWEAGDRDDLIEAAFDFCLTYLNEYLVSLAVGSGNARIDALSRGDFPFLCPVILEAVGASHRVGTTFVRVIHEATPDVAGRLPLPQRVLEAAARFATAGRRGDEPLFAFYELFHGAQAAILRGQFLQGVVLCGTATEVLIDVVLREALTLEGHSSRVEGILKAPFTSRVDDHLQAVTHALLDRHDPNNPLGRWWNDAYRLRNRSVHEGYRPTRLEALAARDATFALVDALGSGLRTQDATRNLGERLRMSPPDV